MTIVEQGGGPAPQAVPDLIKETTTQTFVKDVIEESKRQPVLIDFWAPWCGPCRQLTPTLEKAVRAAKGKVKLVKMNIDEHPAIPGQMGIQSIPAVIAFVNGQPADGFMGAVPESQVNAFIEKLTKGMAAPGEPNIAEILQEAEAVLAEGDPAAAAQIYAEVLAVDSTNIAALAGPGEMLRHDGRGRAGQADHRHGAGIQAQRRRGQGGAGRDRSRRTGASRSVRSPSWNRKSPQTRSIIRRDSIWRPRSMRKATAPKRPTSCSKSSGATANGTRTARASSSCSSSRRGAAPMRPPSMDASGCRRFCFRNVRKAAHDPKAGTGFVITIRDNLTSQHRDRRCRSMPNTADPANFPKSSRCSRCPARCCCRAARCRSIFSSRAIWRWSTMLCATATG